MMLDKVDGLLSKDDKGYQAAAKFPITVLSYN